MMRCKSLFNRLFHITTVLLISPLLFTSAQAQSNLEAEISDIVQQAVPSVVTVLADVPVSKTDQNALSFFSSRPPERKGDEKRYVLVGSGLYLNEMGFIATRSSVVENAMIVHVRLWNGEETHADLIGVDQEKGIALLKIDSPKLPTLPYSRVSSLSAGSLALVIGNSLGVSPAISVGNVTSVYKDGLIRISANIDPGANGAPVLDAAGRVLGIVTGRIAYNQNDDAIVPSGNTVLVVPGEEIYKSALKICVEYQKNHGWIGLTVRRGPYSEINPQVKKVAAGSPAEKAGLHVGDVILSCDGEPFESYYSLRTIVKHTKPGESLRLEILRGQQKQELSLEVGHYDYAGMFESVPFVDDDMLTEEKGDDMPFEWSINRQNAVESRLRQMELEIQNLRKQLRYRKKK